MARGEGIQYNLVSWCQYGTIEYGID